MFDGVLEGKGEDGGVEGVEGGGDVKEVRRFDFFLFFLPIFFSGFVFREGVEGEGKRGKGLGREVDEM